ncbi:MAG TPA: shikimate kinase [Acidimicrobiales bacterium]|nr:shikimate kinase [Acidimicrobiales bacterium]
MTAEAKVLLVGMMGAGKTTVGRLLAERLGWPYLDSDDDVERRTGRTIPEIWSQGGEAAFRREEAVVVKQVCDRPGPAVVSVAGGAVLDPANRAAIRDSGGLVVWLRAGVPTLAARVGGGEGRPLLRAGPAEALSRLSEQRAPVYAELADEVFDVDRLSPVQVCDLVVAALGDRGARG